MKFLFVLLLAATLFLPFQCKKPNPATQLPSIQLKDLNGNAVQLSDYHGKPVIINFWATWCGPCRIEIPMLNEIQRKYASRGLVIVGVSTDEDGAASVKPFLNEIPIHYVNLLKGSNTEETFGGIWGLPTNFFYDKNGKQIAKAFGLQPREFFEEKISEMLSAQ
jgi:thiol-disulfide isomerase/thioredoxin